jgi:GNAT superfamily N-acetyltransferase
MLSVIRTNSNNGDFISLVELLDADLARRDGEDHPFYAQFNRIDSIQHVVVAYDDGQPIACGAIKHLAPAAAEVKRMYVSPSARKKGIATIVLSELEKWAREMGYSQCVLETGKKQPEAICLYEKNGYIVIPNYGQYAGVTNSVCFQKNL